MEMLKPDDDGAARAAELVLKSVERLGARPVRLTTMDPEFAARLKPLADALGAEIKRVRRLAAAAGFRAELMAHLRGFGGGSRR